MWNNNQSLLGHETLFAWFFATFVSSNIKTLKTILFAFDKYQYSFFNEADDNNIEEPRRAICTGALIFWSQFNIAADINSTQDRPPDADNFKNYWLSC